MDFQVDETCSFTSLLHQTTQVNTEDSPAEMTPDVVGMEGSSTGKRGKNFISEEDKVIVSAWLNTSLDSIDGTNMKGDCFWGRVESYFNEWKHVNWPPRSNSSLSHRWGAIQHACNKFCGFLTQVENRHRSGVSNEDNIQEARNMFLAIMRTPFTFDHCWVLLKDQEKWKKREQLPGIKRKSKVKVTKQSKNSTQETINLGEDCDEPHKENDNERPGGRKAAKARKKLIGDVSVILTDLKDEKQKARVEKMEKMKLSNEQKSEFLEVKKSQLLEAREANRIQYEKLQMQSHIENEKLRLERDREDINIMTKDLSSMDAQQQEYFKMRRIEIVRRNGNS